MPEEESGENKEIFGYEKELEDAVAAVEDYLAGKHTNVAIVSDPFAGRTTLVEELARNYKTTTISFSSVMTEKAFISTLHEANDIVIMDNCHFLAMRKIGGFQQLDEFLRFLSSSDRLFITTWNTYSWSYLSAVKNLDKYFPKHIRLPSLDSESLKKMILSRYHQEIEYVDDTEYQERKVSISWTCAHVRLPFSSATYCIPWPYINLSKLFRKKKEETAEKMVFDQLRRISAGNPGVARRIWDASIESRTIWVSSFRESSFDIDLDINEKFLLAIILTMEAIQLCDLSEIAGPEIDVEKSLYILMSRDLVVNDEGYYKINFRALKSVISYLELNRAVW